MELSAVVSIVVLNAAAYRQQCHLLGRQAPGRRLELVEIVDRDTQVAARHRLDVEVDGAWAPCDIVAALAREGQALVVYACLHYSVVGLHGVHP